jgi:glycosyltransferase involved in cell wall biosynthesis
MATESQPPKSASIVITTKNRKRDLRNALASCVVQTAAPEVLVIDDGSTDGTTEMVRSEFPAVRVHRCEESKGLIVRRNEAANLATGEIIFSIDDDAAFSDERTIEQTLSEFDDPRIAAVAIPFVNVNQSPKIHQAAPDLNGVWLTNEFIGTAHAVRRNVFNELGQYREYLFHQGEEGDFCVRALDAGYFVRLGRSQPIWHYESPNRSRARMEVYGQRNLMLFAWHNVPRSALPIHLMGTILKGLAWGLRHGCLWHRVNGTSRGVIAILHEWKLRSPVSQQTYRLYRRLKKKGPLSAASITDGNFPRFVDGAPRLGLEAVCL